MAECEVGAAPAPPDAPAERGRVRARFPVAREEVLEESE